MKLARTFTSVSIVVTLITSAAIVLVLSIAAPVIRSATIPQAAAPSAKEEVRKVFEEDELSAVQPLSLVFKQYKGKVPYYQDAFEDVLRSRLRHRQFSDLEVWATEIRGNKATMPGGRWQLEALYESLDQPDVATKISDEDWKAHLRLFEEWTAASPQSITANVAYAEAMIGYAWFARTDKYASEVTPAQFALFDERILRAHATLTTGSKLAGKCPGWFQAMQTVGLAEGWDRETYLDLFRMAVRFEPSYGAYYYNLANYLLPRWNGAAGEWQSVLAKVTENGDDAVLANYHRAFARIIHSFYEYDEAAPTIKEYWPRIKQGYHAREKLFRLQSVHINDYARMAYIAGDREEAREAFLRIGKDVILSYWEDDRAFYERVRDWSFPD